MNGQQTTAQFSTFNFQLSIINHQRLSHRYFLIGLGLISLVAYTLFFCALSLIRGYPISYWQFPLAGVFMLITQFFAARYFFDKDALKPFLRSAVILLVLSSLSVFLANAIYDVSSEGQAYHQELTAHLKNGFNPYLKILPAPDEDTVPSLTYLGINHSAKGVEITEAAIYRLTGHIESGKAVNAMVLIASFCLCLSLLYKLNRFSTARTWGIAALASFNPISIAQLTSYCSDGVMASVFLCLFVLFCLIFLEHNKNYSYLLGFLIMISVNIKFLSLIYTAVFCAGFLLILIMRKNRALCKRVFYACLISSLLGVFFIGFHPYLTNLISTNQPFYGLTETRNEISNLRPSPIRATSRFATFFLSLTSYSDNQASDKSSVTGTIKFPFSINRQELLHANEPALKMAGFGPFFSGALLLSIALLGLIAYSSSKEIIFKTGLAALGIILLSVFIIPDSWWARFVPQLWLVPVTILFLSELLSLSRGRILNLLLYVVIGLNVVWAFTGIFYNILISAQIRYQLAQLKTISRPISVEYPAGRPFKSNHIRFDENNIHFIEKKAEGQYIYSVIHSSTRFGSAERLPDLPKPFLLRVNEKIRGGDRD